MGEPETVIRVESLGKRYVINHAAERGRYSTLRDTMTTGVRSLVGRLLGWGNASAAATGEEFWALRDVSFVVKRGEVVGVIGRNGAGKSTLLKVLSRITEPTAGRVEIDGRVASLLEVGTGFHPELTGRENIYLNGAILGMSRSEIKRKFDAIVAFAETEKFLDTPVKRYSSGMYMRLAFAVAAHLESEILIVDEVLAVGDAEFQKKCIGQMERLSGSGRTVLFVSHNLGSLLSICRSGLVLAGGRAVYGGDIHGAVARYRQQDAVAPQGLDPRVFRGPLKSVRFEQVLLNDRPVGGHCTTRPGEPLVFRVRGRATSDVPGFRGTFSMFHAGLRLLTMHDTREPELLPEGPFEFVYTIPARLLRPGDYSIALGGRRVAGDEWTWATELAVVEVVEEWGEGCDRDEIGVINLPGRGRRLTGSALPQPVPPTAVNL